MHISQIVKLFFAYFATLCFITYTFLHFLQIIIKPYYCIFKKLYYICCSFLKFISGE